MKDHPAKAAVFLAPNFLGFLLFTIGPVAATVVLSFFSWDLFGAPQFVGLQNFTDLLCFDIQIKMAFPFFGCVLIASPILFFALLQSGRQRKLLFLIAALFFLIAASILLFKAVPRSPKFWQSLWNTIFLLMGLPVGMIASLLLAVLLNEKIFGNHFFRMVYFLPSIVGGVGIYLLWKWIFNTNEGPINHLIFQVSGIPGPAWFESIAWSKPALMIMNLWGSIGGTNMILYLAALQSIDPGLYEAAKIDGANASRKFWHITVPMVSSTSLFIFIMGLIHGFQGGFDSAYVITRGGPAGATTTISYLIYETGFQHFEMGSASAISVLLFFMVLAMSWVSWKFSANRIHYT